MLLTVLAFVTSAAAALACLFAALCLGLWPMGFVAMFFALGCGYIALEASN